MQWLIDTTVTVHWFIDAMVALRWLMPWLHYNAMVAPRCNGCTARQWLTKLQWLIDTMVAVQWLIDAMVDTMQWLHRDG